MKAILYFLLVAILIGCNVYKTDLPVACCKQEISNNFYSKETEVIEILDELIARGIPGIAIAVHSEEGWWHHASGYAKLEDKTLMQTEHLHYLQSIAKLYTAVAIMKLQDQKRIDIERPITHYLPELSGYFKRANEISVKMLMNHTSGIPEYNSDPYYTTQLLQDPTKDWTPWDYLDLVKGKSLIYEPGGRYRYCNMNYVILALLADEITGDHAKYIETWIFEPLGIVNTYYRGQPNYLTYKQLYNGYWDRYSNGIIENTSTLQRQNVSDMIGDDGIVSTPHDAVVFLKGLFDGKLISQESLMEMQEWVTNRDGISAYGLGLDIADFQGHSGMGHSGGGLGAGCQLYYFPEKKISFFIGINLSTVTYSPIHNEAEPVLNKLYNKLLN